MIFNCYSILSFTLDFGGCVFDVGVDTTHFFFNIWGLVTENGHFFSVFRRKMDYYQFDNLDIFITVTSGGVEFSDGRIGQGYYQECSPTFEWDENEYRFNFSTYGNVPPGFEITFVVSYLDC